MTVRAEGELALCEVLEALGRDLPAWDLGALAGVRGISYRDPETGDMVRTDDRERNATLDDIPSPYLTGEFDHLHPTVWNQAYVIFETNRGCPYGCTFCDWGSSTLSRIRKFSLDRVAQEMEWAAVRKLPSWVVADANLGIMSRDVDVVDFMAKQREKHGAPVILGFNVAKNTTKHLTAIVERLVEVGIAPHVSLALQTRDEETLDAVHRQNISTDHYVAMAASFRRNGLPLQADLMLGLPGQTPASIRGDLQFLLEHEVPLRIWITQLLPNSPMNDPEYREQWAIRADENGVVMETASFSAEDRVAMMRLRYAHTVFERFGLLRHIMRYAWWDHGIAATEIMQRAIDRTQEDPESYPLLNWVLRFFDFYPLPPVGWSSFYAEVRRFLEAEYSLGSSPELETVITLQQFLMPDYGRQLPEQIELDHDYVGYYQDATKGLWIDGHATGAPQPLSAYGPRTFTVYGDRMHRNSTQMPVERSPAKTMTDESWMSGHFDLGLAARHEHAEVAADGGFVGPRAGARRVDLTAEAQVRALASQCPSGPGRGRSTASTRSTRTDPADHPRTGLDATAPPGFLPEREGQAAPFVQSTGRAIAATRWVSRSDAGQLGFAGLAVVAEQGHVARPTTRGAFHALGGATAVAPCPPGVERPVPLGLVVDGAAFGHQLVEQLVGEEGGLEVDRPDLLCHRRRLLQREGVVLDPEGLVDLVGVDVALTVAEHMDVLGIGGDQVHDGHQAGRLGPVRVREVHHRVVEHDRLARLERHGDGVAVDDPLLDVLERGRERVDAAHGGHPVMAARRAPELAVRLVDVLQRTPHLARTGLGLVHEGEVLVDAEAAHAPGPLREVVGRQVALVVEHLVEVGGEHTADVVVDGLLVVVVVGVEGRDARTPRVTGGDTEFVEVDVAKVGHLVRVQERDDHEAISLEIRLDLRVVERRPHGCPPWSATLPVLLGREHSVPPRGGEAPGSSASPSMEQVDDRSHLGPTGGHVLG